MPYHQISQAEVVDIPGIRAWGDEFSHELHEDLVDSILNEKPGLFPRGRDGAFQYSSLSLSGGGDHGAFGAGFLKGWSASGSRPTFKIVSGVSTGALIAPFALLGRHFDAELETAYTSVSTSDIFDERPYPSAVWAESLADNHPLEELVHKFVNDEVINEIAQAHRNGQRLFVGTTNLDAQRPVIWNMGMIANSQHPGAFDLFRQVLIASSAIPVLFPPVFFEVASGGSVYDEMHVDGGTVGQMFFYGSSIKWPRVLSEASGLEAPHDESSLFLIIDGQIDPQYQGVQRRLVPITHRTLDTLVKVSAWSALNRMYLHAESEGYGFHYVSLPAEYQRKTNKRYDSAEMKSMFDLGFHMGLTETGWRTNLPNY